MLSCRDTAKINASGQKIPLLKKPSILFNYFICKTCRSYAYHMVLLSICVRKLNVKDEAKEKALEEKILQKFIKNVEKK